MAKIELGQEVKDIITGFKGVAVVLDDHLHSCRRIGVRPRDLDEKGNIRPAKAFDEPQLEIINKKQLKHTRPKKQQVFLGDKVKCPYTDIEGYVLAAGVHLNGCRLIAVAPKKDKYNKVELAWVPEGQVKVQVEPKKEKVKAVKTGGPGLNIKSSFNQSSMDY